MNRAKIFLATGTFGLGVVVTVVAVFVVLSLGFVRAPSSEIAAPLPSDTSDALLSMDGAPTEAPSEGGGGIGEGIKVHGDWTIDVHDADGTLASHTEFENALIGTTGGRRIADILARRMLPRYWGVSIRANLLSNSPCFNSINNQAWLCVIYEPQGIVGSWTSNNLVVTSTTDGILRLSGSIIAQRDGQITSLRTLHNGRPCAVGVDFPDDCGGSAGTEITGAGISPAIEVSEGQSVSVTVEISFE